MTANVGIHIKSTADTSGLRRVQNEEQELIRVTRTAETTMEGMSQETEELRRRIEQYSRSVRQASLAQQELGQNLSEYEKNKLVNISKGDFKFPEDEDEKKISKKLTKYYQPLIDWLKKLLEKNVETVRVSLKMEKDPLVVLAGAHGYSAQMEKVARAQALGAGDKLAFLDAMKKIVEINPYHPFIKELLERVKTNPDKETEDQAKVLFSVALVNSGYSISDITEFSDTFYGIMSDSMGISREAGNVEIDIDNEVEDDPISEENSNNDNKEEENKSETAEDPVNINYDMGENPEVVNTENVSHEL